MSELLLPKYWPSWVVVGVFFALGRLPFPLLWALGNFLGMLAYLVGGSRKRVARRNLEICFSQLSGAKRESLVRQHFRWLGVGVLATGVGWGISRRRLRRLVRVSGRDEIDRLVAEGKPVIVLVPHFVGVDLAGMGFSGFVHTGVAMYKRIRNPVLEWRIRRGREQFGSILVERHEPLKRLIRIMKSGIPFFYLPDQNVGLGDGVFVPFCGIPTSTVPMLGRFARMTEAKVIPLIPRFLSWGRGLEIRFFPSMEDFPSGDQLADTAAMNQLIEQHVRSQPAQYFWVHRRFKTRPKGEASVYPVSPRVE